MVDTMCKTIQLGNDEVRYERQRKNVTKLGKRLEFSDSDAAICRLCAWRKNA